MGQIKSVMDCVGNTPLIDLTKIYTGNIMCQAVPGLPEIGFLRF